MATAPPRKSGQTTSYQSGDDGDRELGVATAHTFTDNNDGTVTDDLTGLVWLKHSQTLGLFTWADALTMIDALESGGVYGLEDGSVALDWRMPNVIELHSLVDYGQPIACLPLGHPFHLHPSEYWSSTTTQFAEERAYIITLAYGLVGTDLKTNLHFVWAVRDA